MGRERLQLECVLETTRLPLLSAHGPAFALCPLLFVTLFPVEVVFLCHFLKDDCEFALIFTNRA